MTITKTFYSQNADQKRRGTYTDFLTITGEPAADLELAEQMLSDKTGAVRWQPVALHA